MCSSAGVGKTDEFFHNRCLDYDYVSNVEICYEPEDKTRETPEVLKLKQAGYDTADCDVVLITSNGQLKAHKKVLAAASHYFSVLFEASTNFKENQENEIEFEFSLSHLQVLLNFVYSCEATNVLLLVEMIDRFQLDWTPLKTKKNLDPCKVLVAASYYKITEIATYFAEKIAENIDEITELKGFSDEDLLSVFGSDSLNIRCEEDLPKLLKKFSLSDEKQEFILSNCQRRENKYNSPESACENLAKPRRFYDTHIHLMWIEDYTNFLSENLTDSEYADFAYRSHRLSCLVPERDYFKTLVKDFKNSHNLCCCQITYYHEGLLSFISFNAITMMNKTKLYYRQLEKLNIENLDHICGVGWLNGDPHIFYDYSPAWNVRELRLAKLKFNWMESLPDYNRRGYEVNIEPVKGIHCFQNIPGNPFKAVFSGDRMFIATREKLFCVDVGKDVMKEVHIEANIYIEDVYRWGESVMIVYSEEVYRIRELDAKTLEWKKLNVSMNFVVSEDIRDVRGGKPRESCGLVSKPYLRFAETEHKLLLIRREYHRCQDKDCDESCIYKSTNFLTKVVQIFVVDLYASLIRQIAEYQNTVAEVNGDQSEDGQKPALPHFIQMIPIQTKCSFNRYSPLTSHGHWYK